MGVANPNPLYPHHQAPFISRPLLSPVLQGRLPWCPAIILALGPPAPAPAPSPLPPRRGEPPLLCAYAHAPNAEHYPGNRPRGRSREWSRGRGVAVGPEHGAGHSFLWPPPAAALGPRSPVTSPSPSCDGPLPSPRLHRHRCLASPQGTAVPPPSARGRRPGYTSPSSGLWRQTRRRDSYPPGINMPCPEIFAKIKSREEDPPGNGTRH
jgi:hypothetical protein